MRRVAFVVLCVGLSLAAQTAVDVSPRIGLIEIFGLRKASPKKVEKAIGAKAGDPFPGSEAAEDRINKVPFVAVSRLEAACCSNNGSMILYVGLEERDTPHIEFNPVPAGDARLPDELYESYLRFLEQVEGSIRGRNADEDLTNGYSLMADPDARAIQENFVPAVEKSLDFIDKVVRECPDSEQRAAAAYLLQYGPRGRQAKIITDALLYAIRDPEDIVRKNAFRALRAVYIGAKLHPDQAVPIEPAWVVATLNSIVFSDRRAAAQLLVDLTEDRNAETLSQIRDRALPSVLEMARWQTLDHALPAFILAGRVAGADEKTIKEAWSRNDRESILASLDEPKKGHKRK